MKKLIISSLFLTAITFIFTSCSRDNSKPGYEYMPDMAHSVAYETYTTNPNYADNQTNRQPVKGTIPLFQGMIGVASNFKPYPFANTVGGYDSAAMFIFNPLANTEENLKEGHRLFEIYCSPCHGKKGNGDGSIVVNPNIKNPYPAPPSYFSERLLGLKEGNMFHSIHYGRNLMGSYATQIDQKQIWQVIHYIRGLQSNYVDSMKTINAGALIVSKDSINN
jgi:mono/diheme cytochrome c family protein